MIMLIICIVVAVGCFLWGLSEDGIGSAFFLGFFGGFIGFLIGLLVVLFGCCMFESMPAESKAIEYNEDVKLIALEDNFGTSGRGYLFSSYVKDELKYVYLYEDEIHGITTNSVDADKVYIKYIDNSETPHIQKWSEVSKSKVFNWLFWPCTVRYTIYLPEGAVIENTYEVDLE